MDVFLGRLTSQAMNYAIRSGITITTTYAIRQCARLVEETSPGSHYREELLQLQQRLESKVRILSPSIDMIELISARGNTTLESAVNLTKSIRMDIQKLGTKVANAAEEGELLRKKGGARAKVSREQGDRGLADIIHFIKALLVKIEDAIPLINLAITTSGVNLSTKLSGTISPSRLLQASTFLTAADSKYVAQPGIRQQVGPTWTLSLYMLFAGHANRAVDEDGVREATWKEVVHKARVKLIRVPLEGLYDLSGEYAGEHAGEHLSMRSNTIPAEARANEFAYQLVVVEDFDDDRVHTFEDDDEPQPEPFEDVINAGIRDVVPIHEVSKIFYADTGKILNIGGNDETNNPVLLLKRDVHAEPPRRMLHRSTSQMSNYAQELHVNGTVDHNVDDVDEQSEIDAQLHRESTPNTPQVETKAASPRSPRWRLPVDLDQEWMAFEVYLEEPDSESDLDDSAPPSRPTSSGREDSLGPDLMSALSDLKLKSPSSQPKQEGLNPPQRLPLQVSHMSKEAGPRIKTSLSLLEMLVKLTALQQFRQDSHLAIEDELLNFFLEDSATAGAGPDKDFRQRLRHDAVRRVGFDPYDESPVKRRGEEYIAHKRGKASPRPEFDINAFQARLPSRYDHDQIQIPDFVRPSIEQPLSSPCGSTASPSPHPTEVRKTTSKVSIPLSSTSAGGIHHNAVQARSSAPKAASQASLLAAPPSMTKSQPASVRAQSEPKPGSPLIRQFSSEDVGNNSLEDSAAGC